MPENETDPYTETVYMKHDGIDGIAETTQAAFDEVWQPKGWKKASDQDVQRSAGPDPVLAADDDAPRGKSK